MATLFQFSERMSQLNNKDLLYKFLFDQIRKAEEQFVKAQQEQLNKGEDNEGNVIGTYSFASEQISKGKRTRKPKIQGQNFNYENTGEFFDRMFLAVGDNTAAFWSDDEKTPLLTVKYKDLFGLQKDALQKLIETLIYPAIMKDIRRVLNLS